MRHASSRFLSLVVALALQGCNDHPAPTELAGNEMRAASMTPAEHTGRQIVLFRAQRVPADFSERVERLGGRLEASLDSIGISIVVGLSDGAAAALASDGDVRAVFLDCGKTFTRRRSVCGCDGKTFATRRARLLSSSR